MDTASLALGDWKWNCTVEKDDLAQTGKDQNQTGLAVQIHLIRASGQNQPTTFGSLNFKFNFARIHVMLRLAVLLLVVLCHLGVEFKFFYAI